MKDNFFLPGCTTVNMMMIIIVKLLCIQYSSGSGSTTYSLEVNSNVLYSNGRAQARQGRLAVEVCCFRTGQGDRRQSRLNLSPCCWLQNLNNNTTRSTLIVNEDLEMIDDDDKKVQVWAVLLWWWGGGRRGGEIL